MNKWTVERIKFDAHKVCGEIYNGIFESWYYDEKLTIPHRVDGPAITRYVASTSHVLGIEVQQEWWHMGVQANCSSQEEFEKLLPMKAFW